MLIRKIVSFHVYQIKYPFACFFCLMFLYSAAWSIFINIATIFLRTALFVIQIPSIPVIYVILVNFTFFALFEFDHSGLV